MWQRRFAWIIIKIISNLYLSHCRNWFCAFIHIVDARVIENTFRPYLTQKKFITLISRIWSNTGRSWSPKLQSSREPFFHHWIPYWNPLAHVGDIFGESNSETEDYRLTNKKSKSRDEITVLKKCTNLRCMYDF